MRKCVESWLRNREIGQTDPIPKYYVYEYIDPITSKVFYVGKGTRQRNTIHLRDVKRDKLPNDNNGKLYRCIKQILDKGLEPLIVKVNENIPEIDALALEAACIEHYGLDNLCNYAQSGIGAVAHTIESKAKCRWGAMEQAANRLGGWNKYFQRIYQAEEQRKLKEDLRLLKNVINDIRKDLKQERQEDKAMAIKNAYKPRQATRKRFNRLSLWVNT